MRAIILSLLTLLCVSLFSCQKPLELSLSEIQRLTASADSELLAKTTSKPYNNHLFARLIFRRLLKCSPLPLRYGKTLQIYTSNERGGSRT